jgi:hypothetical protein
MTQEDFRRMALSLEGASERAHMGHPDFRAGGKVFATLGYPDNGWAMVKLAPEEQRNFTGAYPEAFVPVKGAWGRGGCTSVLLRAANVQMVQPALDLAWASVTAPGLKKKCNRGVSRGRK